VIILLGENVEKRRKDKMDWIEIQNTLIQTSNILAISINDYKIHILLIDNHEFIFSIQEKDKELILEKLRGIFQPYQIKF
jgi:hypothetical protein